MSHMKPGKRRESDGGLATLEPEQHDDGQARHDGDGADTPDRGAADEGERPCGDSVASEDNGLVPDGAAITMADMAARIARCSPQAGVNDVLVDCIPGVRVVRATGLETGRDRDATKAGGLTHTIWMRLCLLLVLGLNGLTLAVAHELPKMDAV